MPEKRNAISDDLATRTPRTKNEFQVKWAEEIGNPDCPLMRRWVWVTPVGSVRLHHFLRSDDDRARHDHPWWFITLVLKGHYDDDAELEDADGTMRIYRDHLRPGSIRYRPALHRHQVKTKDVWTLVVTGRIRRVWGFWDHVDQPRGRFWPVARFFERWGYVPCAALGDDDA